MGRRQRSGASVDATAAVPFRPMPWWARWSRRPAPTSPRSRSELPSGRGWRSRDRRGLRLGWCVGVSVDPRAASGFSGSAEAYERGRPSYPVAAVARVMRERGLSQASTALDLAAGTGKLTRVLVDLVGEWKAALESTRRFTPIEQAEADYEHQVSPDDFVALVASWSWIANLPERPRADVLAGVRDLLTDQSSLTLRYRTEIYSALVR